MTSQDPYLHGRSDFQQHRHRQPPEGLDRRDQNRYDFGYDSAREDHEREEHRAERQQRARDEQRQLEEQQMAEMFYEDQRAEEAYGQYQADQAANDGFEQGGGDIDPSELPF